MLNAIRYGVFTRAHGEAAVCDGKGRPAFRDGRKRWVVIDEGSGQRRELLDVVRADRHQREAVRTVRGKLLQSRPLPVARRETDPLVRLQVRAPNVAQQPLPFAVRDDARRGPRA